MKFLGIDPGQNGALVAVAEDGLSVLGVQTWKKSRTPPRLDPALLRGAALLALEAQHVGGPHASLVLATWCGYLLGTLPPGLPVQRPLATSWRAKVFRSGRLSREAAKALAIAAATPHLAAAGHPNPSHDLAEAWCLARWACFYVKAHSTEFP